ncbi:MAG: membrane dipeptidase [Deinococcales bacterium]|nr:membrane dipeptidase [Deinococcales bacterium]
MIPVFDGHNDTVLQHLDDPARDFFARHDDGHLDAVRAAEGGLVGGFFAVYTRSPAVGARYQDAIEAAGLSKPTPLGAIDPTDAVRNTNAAVATILGWAADPEGRFRVARSVAELEAAMADGVMAGVLHFEGAEAIGPDLAALDVYHAAGLRSLGPVWSRPNLFAEGVPFAYPSSPDTGPGLTAHGRALVRRCNELRIMIDLSHINERGFWDVAALSDAPLVATHSNAHAICPSARNLTDEQLAAVRASQGVVGLNFAVAFLAPDGRFDRAMPLEVMVRHVDHLVDKLGIDGVALGSDFDGAGIPDAIGDVTGVQRLLEALREAGYDQEALEKIAYRNWLRVLRLTWGG